MERKSIEKKIVSKCSNTIREYQLIEPNDKILVGLSGGKDSLVLIKLLSIIKKHIPFSFEVEAVYIDIQEVPYNADVGYLETYCKALDIPFTKADVSQKTNADASKKNPCFVCSWHRRKSLFAYCKNKKYNKLALGHHLDDAAETLLMNMMYHASISSLPPKLKMFDGALTVIRPLIEIKEDLIIEYANTFDFKPMIKTCPFEKKSSRQFAKELLKQMEERYDRVKNNIFASMRHIDSEYLP